MMPVRDTWITGVAGSSPVRLNHTVTVITRSIWETFQDFPSVPKVTEGVYVSN